MSLTIIAFLAMDVPAVEIGIWLVFKEQIQILWQGSIEEAFTHMKDALINTGKYDELNCP